MLILWDRFSIKLESVLAMSCHIDIKHGDGTDTAMSQYRKLILEKEILLLRLEPETFRSRLRLLTSRELNDMQVAWNSVHWGAGRSSVVRATDS